MKKIPSITVFVFMIIALTNCNPGEHQSFQVAQKPNFVISPDSTEKLDPAIISGLVNTAIDLSSSENVFINSQPGVLYLMINQTDNTEIDFVQIHHVNNQITSVEYEKTYPPSKLDHLYYPVCPNNSIETLWSTEMTTIQSAASQINNLHSLATSKGYTSTRLLGQAENVTNVLNYLSCPCLRIWGRVGHGYTGGLQLANGQTLSTFSVNLNGKGIFAYSPMVFNQPFKSRVESAGADWFIGGKGFAQIISVFSCWASKALSQMDVCSALDSCCNPSSCPLGCEHFANRIPRPTRACLP